MHSDACRLGYHDDCDEGDDDLDPCCCVCSCHDHDAPSTPCGQRPTQPVHNHPHPDRMGVTSDTRKGVTHGRNGCHQ